MEAHPSRRHCGRLQNLVLITWHTLHRNQVFDFARSKRSAQPSRVFALCELGLGRRRFKAQIC
jgi:hypothetical protein